MFGALRRLLKSGNIKEVFASSRNIFRQFQIEIQVARGRSQLRGGQAGYGNAYGRNMSREDYTPFSLWLQDFKRQENALNRENFWGGDLSSSEQDSRVYDFLEQQKYRDLGLEGQWAEQWWLNYMLPSWKDWRLANKENRLYNPYSGIRAEDTPSRYLPDWWSYNEPVQAEGIYIAPWSSYDFLRPIEMRQMPNPFVNNPRMPGNAPLIDINRPMNGWG